MPLHCWTHVWRDGNVDCSVQQWQPSALGTGVGGVDGAGGGLELVALAATLAAGAVARGVGGVGGGGRGRGRGERDDAHAAARVLGPSERAPHDDWGVALSARAADSRDAHWSSGSTRQSTSNNGTAPLHIFKRAQRGHQACWP